MLQRHRHLRHKFLLTFYVNNQGAVNSRYNLSSKKEARYHLCCGKLVVLVSLGVFQIFQLLFFG
jgi:hypothetical protein